jgi:4-amino-4-deoxy-L-arabinose transferase-like glycosyltransferase
MSSPQVGCHLSAPVADRERVVDGDGLIGTPCLAGLWIFGLCFLSFFIGISSSELWGIRQKRMAACVADIFYDGRWLLPHMCGHPRLEKPPLPYWIIAGFACSVGRLNEWTLRVPGACAGLIIVGLTYAMARQAGGVRSGLLAAVFLCTSPFFASEVRQPSSDLFLALFTACGMSSWWVGFRNAKWRSIGWSISGLSIGLACLTKGPVVLVFLAPPIVGTLWMRREALIPRSNSAWIAIVIALMVGLSWPLIAMALSGAAWGTWIAELDSKVGGTGTPEHSPLYYLTRWPYYLFPWSAFSVAAVVDGAISFRRLPREIQFAWLWFVGSLVLFSIANARKEYYLLPAVPGLAILSGNLAARFDHQTRCQRCGLIGQLIVQLQFGIFLLMCVSIGLVSLRIPIVSWGTGLGVGGVGVLLCIGVWCWRRSRTCAPAWLAIALALAALDGGTYLIIMPRLDKYRSHGELAKRVQQVAGTDMPIAAIGDNDPGLWFYLKNRPRAVREEDLCCPTMPGVYLVPEPELKEFTLAHPEAELVYVDPDYDQHRWRVAVTRVQAVNEGSDGTSH